ncbi:MAG TPA: DUF885 domain-containing protein [Candidatus Blautia intestinavium]|uniref:DUF885 domain-containing protein n=1 Tax=Candidatus Blautia avicola TaxID=2838483 RepID=A0A9D2QTU7_9FIRM|nr:DUF885 domain-containing protein [Candidatus Blautia intestinavium]HJD27948.1 DUF885 domain-containing protein [Candidatus Blautia avicola]
MSLSFRKCRKPILIALLLCLTLLTGTGIGYFTNHVWSEDGRFRSFTRKVFQKEVSGSLLSLHYSLAHPEKENIDRPAPTLGTVTSDMTDTYQLCRDYISKLKSFSYSELSRENRLTLDMLLLCFDTQLSLEGQELLEEMLSPSLGIQAQLPVLLAEYAFYEDQDISDYLNLLTSIEPYFDSILQFEEEKAAAGLFMSDKTLERILEQCRAFIQNPESNYMLEVFSEKLKDYGKFSPEDQKELEEQHKNILLNKVIPAYQKLMSGLESLKGSGASSRGLAHFPGGQEYYEYLLKSQVGAYTSVEQIRQRLTAQLEEDLRTIQLMLKEQPSLLRKLTDGTDLSSISPQNTLELLSRSIQKDFPALGETDYEVRYVHESMEDYLSPAFYLTPPLDTGSPNVIYINRASSGSNLELFTTLAHEGFPGHLYQTVYFASCRPDDIRYLFSSGGYVEGWATYIESYAYQYAADLMNDSAAADLTRLAWLNRSVNLCLYSLMDIGIHYQGWTQAVTERLLNSMGITDASAAAEIYQYIVETPANYLKYYWGYLNFLDLKNEKETTLGDDFNLKEFHRQILEIGPVQFPVLEKYMNPD